MISHLPLSYTRDTMQGFVSPLPSAIRTPGRGQIYTWSVEGWDHLVARNNRQPINLVEDFEDSKKKIKIQCGPRIIKKTIRKPLDYTTSGYEFLSLVVGGTEKNNTKWITKEISL